MRIAIVTTDDRETFKKYNHLQPLFGPAPEALLQGFATMPEVTIHVIACLQKPTNSPKKIAPNIFFHDLHVPKIGWLRTGYQGCIRAVRKNLAKIQPDIVHGQGTERDCGISAIFSGFPNVITIHGNMRAIAKIYGQRIGSFHWLTGKLETFTLKRTAGVFCNSLYTENWVAPIAKKIWRVPNALRRDFFSPSLKANSSKPIFLNVGVLEPRKQQVELLDVARKLYQCGLQFEFQFAGEPVRHTQYGLTFFRELAAAEKAGYARHLGKLSEKQLIDAMDHAGALIHFPMEEAFGLVVAEALARNLKFFGSRTGGIIDIARNVKDAELFSEKDFSALENALAKWLMEGYPQSTNAAVLMRQRYHPEIIARRHLEIYREVLSEKKFNSR